jgi:hypothetical protein
MRGSIGALALHLATIAILFAPAAVAQDKVKFGTFVAWWSICASAETFTTRHPRRHQSLQSGTPPRVPSDITPMMRSARRSCRPLNVTEHSSAERRLVRVCALPDDRSRRLPKMSEEMLLLSRNRARCA